VSPKQREAITAIRLLAVLLLLGSLLCNLANRHRRKLLVGEERRTTFFFLGVRILPQSFARLLELSNLHPTSSRRRTWRNEGSGDVNHSRVDSRSAIMLLGCRLSCDRVLRSRTQPVRQPATARRPLEKELQRALSRNKEPKVTPWFQRNDGDRFDSARDQNPSLFNLFQVMSLNTERLLQRITDKSYHPIERKLELHKGGIR
jgi:hypothetical protein